MKIKIPYDLRMKFLTYEGLNFTQEVLSLPSMNGTVTKVPGAHHATVKLNLSKDPDCLKACMDWMDMAYAGYSDYADTSYKIDLGGYLGLWPNEINSDCIVSFVMDKFDSSKKHWKDWFIIDEEKEIENASK
jgi:hypothetical protein